MQTRIGLAKPSSRTVSLGECQDVCAESRCDCPSFIARSIVDNDDLGTRVPLTNERREQSGEMVRLVPCGDDDGDQRLCFVCPNRLPLLGDSYTYCGRRIGHLRQGAIVRLRTEASVGAIGRGQTKDEVQHLGTYLKPVQARGTIGERPAQGCLLGIALAVNGPRLSPEDCLARWRGDEGAPLHPCEV